MLDKSVRVQFIFWLNSERQDSPEKNQIYKIDESAITVYNSNKLLKKFCRKARLFAGKLIVRINCIL